MKTKYVREMASGSVKRLSFRKFSPWSAHLRGEQGEGEKQREGGEVVETETEIQKDRICPKGPG